MSSHRMPESMRSNETDVVTKCTLHSQAEEARVKETARRTDDMDTRSVALRAQLESDAITLRKAQKATEAERAAQKVRHCSLTPLLNSFS